jgi:hypothetical protein
MIPNGIPNGEDGSPPTLQEMLDIARGYCTMSIDLLVTMVGVKITDEDLKEVLVDLCEQFRPSKDLYSSASKIYEIGKRLRRELET